jgi:anti-sigma regulatory factor (Ser/Thr protein kinase)
MQDIIKPTLHLPRAATTCLELTLGADLRRLVLYRNLAREFLQGHVPWAGGIEDLIIVIDEALTNVVRHSYAEQPGEPITLRMVVEVLSEPVLAHLAITLYDRGKGGRSYRPEEHLARARALAEVGETTGFGLILMDRLMDRVSYEATTGRNRLVLEKWLGPDPFALESMLQQARDFSADSLKGLPLQGSSQQSPAPAALPPYQISGNFELEKIIRRR